MIAEFFALPLMTQVVLFVLGIFIFVGALVVGTFVLDVIVAAARAASLVALHIRLRSVHLPNDRAGVLIPLSLWREKVFAFYRDRYKRSTWTIQDVDGSPLAVWRGVFRWDFDVKRGGLTNEH